MKIQLFPRWAVALALGAAISLAGPAVAGSPEEDTDPGGRRRVEDVETRQGREDQPEHGR